MAAGSSQGNVTDHIRVWTSAAEDSLTSLPVSEIDKEAQFRPPSAPSAPQDRSKTRQCRVRIYIYASDEYAPCTAGPRAGKP